MAKTPMMLVALLVAVAAIGTVQVSRNRHRWDVPWQLHLWCTAAGITIFYYSLANHSLPVWPVVGIHNSWLHGSLPC
jgi:hypothetical protein